MFVLQNCLFRGRQRVVFGIFLDWIKKKFDTWYVSSKKKECHKDQKYLQCRKICDCPQTVQCFRKRIRYWKSIRNFPRTDKYTKTPATKAPSKKSSSEEKYDSYFSLSSSSETLTNEADNQKKMAYNKRKVKPDDLVHQENAAVSFGIIEENFKRRKMISMSLTKLYFQTKPIRFANFFMYNYNIKMIRKNIKETNVSSSNK